MVRGLGEITFFLSVKKQIRQDDKMVGNMFSLCKFSNPWLTALGGGNAINVLIVDGGLQF